MYDYAEHEQFVENIQQCDFYFGFVVVFIYLVVVFYLCRVPPSMRTYALLLLYSTCWSAIFDILLKVGELLPFFPIPVVAITGIAADTITGVVLFPLIIFSLHMTVFSLSNLYSYRLQIILKTSDFSLKPKFLFILQFNFLLQLSFCVEIFLVLRYWVFVDDQLKLNLSKGYENLPSVFFTNNSVLMVPLQDLPRDCFVLGYATWAVSHDGYILVVLPYLTHFSLKHMSSKMSTKTLAMHKSVLKALIYQTGIHMGIFGINVCYFNLTYTGLINTNPTLMALNIQGLKMHGPISTFSMLLVHPMILKIVKKDFQRLKGRSVDK